MPHEVLSRYLGQVGVVVSQYPTAYVERYVEPSAKGNAIAMWQRWVSGSDASSTVTLHNFLLADEQRLVLGGCHRTVT
jgi:hypothetical protein